MHDGFIVIKINPPNGIFFSASRKCYWKLNSVQTSVEYRRFNEKFALNITAVRRWFGAILVSVRRH